MVVVGGDQHNIWITAAALWCNEDVISKNLIFLCSRCEQDKDAAQHRPIACLQSACTLARKHNACSDDMHSAAELIVCILIQLGAGK